MDISKIDQHSAKSLLGNGLDFGEIPESLQLLKKRLLDWVGGHAGVSHGVLGIPAGPFFGVSSALLRPHSLRVGVLSQKENHDGFIQRREKGAGKLEMSISA